MKFHREYLLKWLLLASISGPVMAQTGVPGEIGEPIPGEIVVTGDRLRGQLNVEQAPILELNQADIEAIGATSVSELLDAIAPQTGSSRGRGGGAPPVFLVNGIRIGSFREMRSYPPEAIAKVEVLPEEVAQKFGFPPDRRVVNMILKENFSNREAEARFDAPSRGGNSRNRQRVSLLNIADGARLNANLEVNDTSMLTEAERDVIQTPGSVPAGISDEEFARFRSLVADSFQVEGTVNWARAIIESGSSLSFNLTGQHNRSRALSGLRNVATLDPLERRNKTESISSSASYGRRLGPFQLTVTADANLTDSTTKIDRISASGFDTANSKTITSESKAILAGSLFDLPAGELSVTFSTGFDWMRIDSSDTRSASDAKLTRRRLDGGASIAVPIAERGGAWGAIGSLSANFSAGIEDLSDFGTLNNWTAGLTWEPASSLTLSATRIISEAAPSLTQLGSPQTVTFNVPVFDFVRGESVLAAMTRGGNPDLLTERQRDWKFNANWELPFWKNTRLSVDYVRNNSSDVTGSFPAITAEIEAAFPGRVTRDGTGQIIAVDARPVTYAESRASRLVFGLNTRGSFGEAKSGERGGEGAARGRPGNGGGPRGFGRPGGDGRGRYFVNLTHQVELDNTLLITNGGPLLDLLDGDATGDFGTPRHTSSLELGVFRNGRGIRLSGRYSGKSRIEGSGQPGSTDLYFGDLAKLDVRVFADLGRLFKQEQGILKNLRFILRAENVFDAHRKVTDSSGNVPLSYQPDLIDPDGRYLGIDLRKMF